MSASMENCRRLIYLSKIRLRRNCSLFINFLNNGDNDALILKGYNLILYAIPIGDHGVENFGIANLDEGIDSNLIAGNQQVFLSYLQILALNIHVFPLLLQKTCHFLLAYIFLKIH